MFNLDNKNGFNSYFISFLHTLYDTPELRYLPLEGIGDFHTPSGRL